MDNLRALVLNSTYEPLQFTSVRRALVLSMLGKAEALEYDGVNYRTATKNFRAPTVIKLRRYIRRPIKTSVSFSKKNVLRRDNHTCQYCGSYGGELTIDHLRPRSKGGKSTWDNVVAACRECNLRKGDRALEEAGMKLMKLPKRPKTLLFTFSTSNVPQTHLQSWAKYLPNLH